MNALAHVVRCFDDDNVTHVDGSVDPVRDAEIINLELIYSDLETVSKRLTKCEKLLKTNDKKNESGKKYSFCWKCNRRRKKQLLFKMLK